MKSSTYRESKLSGEVKEKRFLVSGSREIDGQHTTRLYVLLLKPLGDT